jgi:hypothetical protein
LPYSLFFWGGFPSSPPSSSSVTDVGCDITSRRSSAGASHRGQTIGDADPLRRAGVRVQFRTQCVIIPTRPWRRTSGLNLGCLNA